MSAPGQPEPEKTLSAPRGGSGRAAPPPPRGPEDWTQSGVDMDAATLRREGAAASAAGDAPPDAATLDSHKGTPDAKTILEKRESAPGAKTLDSDRVPTMHAPGGPRGSQGARPSGRTPSGRTPPRTPPRTPGRGGSSGGTWGVEGPLVDIAGGRFGRYQLEGELGRGGMGVVYRARHVDLNRLVALKVMLAGAFADDNERRRFLREAESAAVLTHPNIVGVHDFDELEGNAYFTMDFVEGEPLSSKITPGGMPTAEVVTLMTKIADAVGYAHLRGTIHRDLKPANVMIDKDGEPRLLDFGLAKRIGAGAQAPEAEAALAKTVEGALLGTPYYMAPEQAAGTIADIDTRSDVWALGVMLFEMLTGERPFTGTSVHDILLRIIGEDPPSIRERKRGIDIELEGIVMRCLEREKDRRYATGRDLAQDLERYARGEAVSARRVSLIYRMRKKIRRHKALSLTLSAATIALAVLVGTQAVLSRTEAERHIALGRSAREKEDWEAARDHFGAALAARSGIEEAINGRAEAQAMIKAAQDAAEKKKLDEAAETARTREKERAENERRAELERLIAGGRKRVDEALGLLAAGHASTPAAHDGLRSSLLDAEGEFQRAIAIAPTSTAAAQGRFDALAALANLALSEKEFGTASVMAAFARATGVATATANALKDKIRDAMAAAQGVEKAFADGEATLEGGKVDEGAGMLAIAARDARKIGLDVQARVDANKRRINYHRARQEGMKAQTARSHARAIERFTAARAGVDSQAERAELERFLADAAGLEIGRLLTEADLNASAGRSKEALDLAREAARVNDASAGGADRRPGEMLRILEERQAAPEGMAYIASDPFRAGSDEKPDLNPGRDATLPRAVYLSLRETSNREYAGFVAGGGYTDAALEKHWDAEARPLRARLCDRTGRPGPASWVDGKPAPELAATPGMDLQDLPVTGISWFEARAFARWKGGGLRLPSDDEWEKAALIETAGKRRRFPWGDEFPEGDALRALVGGFPERGFVEVWNAGGDRSPSGCLLMGGNVHEWCNSLPDSSVETMATPVLRGGGARLPFASFARGTRRFVPSGPAFRGIGTGVRLAKDALR